MQRSAVAPGPSHDTITRLAQNMQRAARAAGTSADSQAQTAARLNSSTSGDRSVAVTKLSSAS